ncbi:CoA pyrophosphatase [Flavobacterium sp. F-380]|uniref:CoA pyrophosphatase n=1 Tax=Flavobacterium kayseriense TaxID=2764714 RepID=A0ABR7J6P4_9FLAO|nr:CoA pyrophosphatase [Flavobacterium kayseriense]MBC5841116.1 CoA pyrophosphatase [Flavobacterium kayseriense]MBC5847644.1 CoA pyrophosphatase [Flavobacterium kayseriense]
MDFQYFLEHVAYLAEAQLPAMKAHAIMAPIERLETLQNPINVINTPRTAAVLMLLYPKKGETHLVLIVRNAYEGVHSAQVAFPGGKYEDTDSDFAYTALRETQEEVGVNPQEVELIKPFTPMYIPPSNFMVHPFLGFAKQELRFVPDPSEVARIIELPLAVFLDESIVIETRLATSYAKEISVPAFNIEETIVWGATAMMLSELKEVLKSVFEYKT